MLPLLLAAALASAACVQGTPLRERDLPSPALHAIQAAFTRTTDEIKSDPNHTWVSGPWGNRWINGVASIDESLRADFRGYCFQWQERVYLGVNTTVRRVGWELCGVRINMNLPHEHHAVLVWDPRVISKDRILAAPRPRPAYVLDAWRHGQPEIFTLDDWEDAAFRHESPVQLEDVLLLDLGGHAPPDAPTPSPSDTPTTTHTTSPPPVH